MRDINQVKSEFIAASAPLAAKMGQAAQAGGFQSPQYVALSGEYAALRMSFGIRMKPSAPAGWVFLPGREKA